MFVKLPGGIIVLSQDDDKVVEKHEKFSCLHLENLSLCFEVKLDMGYILVLLLHVY